MPDEDLASLFNGPPLMSDSETRDAVAFLKGIAPENETNVMRNIRDDLARQVLCDFCFRQHTGKAQSSATLSWLAGAFDKILAHQVKDLREAFGVKRRATGRPKETAKQVDVALWVHFAQVRCGLSPVDAKHAAASVVHRDYKKVEEYCAKHGDEVSSMREDFNWEEFFLTRKLSWLSPPRPWPLPPTKNRK